MVFITSAGFAISDYFDRESDAIVKPKCPIPAGALTHKQVVAVSSVRFSVSLIMAYLINWLSSSSFWWIRLYWLFTLTLWRRKSGFAANILVGIIAGTAFLYGQATVLNCVRLVSLNPLLSRRIIDAHGVWRFRRGWPLESRLSNIILKKQSMGYWIKRWCWFLCLIYFFLANL
jgi:hypothetical protein